MLINIVLWLKLDLDSMHGNSVGLFVVVVPSVVQEVLLTSEYIMSMGYNLPMTVFLGICTVLCSMLSRGICSNLIYLWSNLRCIVSGIIPGGKLLVVSNWYRCFVLSLVGALTDMTDTLLGGNMADSELQIIGLVLEEGILVHMNLLLCEMYHRPFMFQLQPVL